MSSVLQYVGFFHVLKDHVKESWTQFWENSSTSGNAEAEHHSSNGEVDEKDVNLRSRVKVKLEKLRQQSIHIIDKSSNDQEDYSHLTRPKSRKELMQISAAVMGIEFAYAAETAFVSPLLLNIGLRHRHMTMIWCLSPLLGFFLTPLLGSLSDGCRLALGRRRPFILLLSIGVVLGLILVPNGKTLGRMMGDTYADDYEVKSSEATAARLMQFPRPSVNLSNNYDHTELHKEDQAYSIRMDSNQSNKTEKPIWTIPNDNLSDSGESLDFHSNLLGGKATANFEEDGGGKESNLKNKLAEKEAEEERLAYKRHSAKFEPMEEEHGFRVRNSLFHKDKELDEIEFFKSVGKKNKEAGKMNFEAMQDLVQRAVEGAGQGESKEDSEDRERNLLDSTNERKEESSNEKETEFNSSGGIKQENNMSRSKRLGTSGKESGGTTDKDRSERKDGNENGKGSNKNNFDSGSEEAVKSHPWGLIFTVIGTVLLDFDADACQSPSRAYMLDVTIPEDHAKGLSTFTIMAGLGGSIGYFLGALNWENTFMGRLFGGHVRAVFTLVLFIFIACVIATVRSFREIPVDRLWANKPGSGGGGGLGGCGPPPSTVLDPKPKPNIQHVEKTYARLEDDSTWDDSNNDSYHPQKSYGTIQETSFNSVAQPLPSSSLQRDLEASSKNSGVGVEGGGEDEVPTFKEYVKTIVQLPRSLQWLCATNFFCWMSLVCYSLYFTDFVGEAVFGGDPTAPRGSLLKEKYDEGVRFGCWGMSLYSLSCSIYSICIESLVNRFGARRVYIYGQLVYSVGMVFMALARHPAGVIIFSWTAGIMYATLFTMPYLLVARYHAAETFDIDVDDLMEKQQQVRGLGTDVAIVSSMVFLAQITQALTLGAIVTAVGSTTAIVCAAAVFASCGAACATKVLYLDL